MKNVYRRNDGRFEGRFRDSKTVKTRYFYGRSKAEVERKMTAYISAREVSDERLTVKMLFAEWLEEMKFKVKESTFANYVGKAQAHILPRFGSLCTDELTPDMLRGFITERLADGLSAGYVADIVILFKSVLKYGEKRHNIKNNISEVILPKKKRAEISLPDSVQRKRLEKWLCDNMNMTSAGIMLCMYTGIRLGELCALKWSDIDISGKTLSVSKTIQRISCPHGTKLVITEPKSASSVRVVPIPDRVVKLLTKFKAEGDCFFLSGMEKPVEPRTMQYRFKSVLKKAKLPSIHFHALRHVFATNCVEMGFDIKTLSEILGHSGVEITLNRYVHSSLERKKRFMKNLRFAA